MIRRLVNAIAGPKQDQRMRKILADPDLWAQHLETLETLKERVAGLELKGHTGSSIVAAFRNEGYGEDDVVWAMQGAGYFAITEDRLWFAFYGIGTQTRRLRVSEWSVLRGLLDTDPPEYARIWWDWMKNCFTRASVVQFPGAAKFELPVRWKVWLIRNFMWWWDNDMFAAKQWLRGFVPVRWAR